MRTIPAEAIRDAIRALYGRAACELPPDVVAALEAARRAEESPAGREVLSQILQNAAITREGGVPICQDTGLAVVLLELGQDVHIQGGSLGEAVDEGVRRAARDFGLRASALSPLTRQNTSDNTPAMLHVEVVPGDGATIHLLPKGFGSENMSRLFMLNPSDGIPGVEDAIVTAARDAGGNPCPPVILGVGIGGSAESAMLLAKKTLLRPTGAPAPDADLAAMEARCLERINALGIGPMGLGGRVSALAVHIAQMPTHIAALPVAVNVQCHCARRASAVL